MTARIAFARINQETNALSPVTTSLEDFQATHFLEGDALLRAASPGGDEVPQMFRRAELAGFVDAARAHARDIEPVPLFSAWAVASGPLTRAAFDALQERLVDGLRKAGRVDGVYLSRAPGSVLEMLDVDRVEVLRGPQGTLFGKNTIGGAIQVVTKTPTGQFGGDAQLTLGNFNRVDLNSSVEFPLVEGKLSGRVSALTRRQDGFYQRLAYAEGNPNQFGADQSRTSGNDT